MKNLMKLSALVVEKLESEEMLLINGGNGDDTNDSSPNNGDGVCSGSNNGDGRCSGANNSGGRCG